MKGNIKNLLNKNTISLIIAIVFVIIIYFIYDNEVNRATVLVNVPVAKTTISPRVTITEEVISYVRVPKNVVDKLNNIELTESNIVGKLVDYNCTIEPNSFFFKNQLTTKEDLTDPSVANIPDTYTVFTLPVTLASTLGNSIYPGNYIDLYLSGTYDDGKVLYGKFIESIEVLDVKDRNGQHVFESTTENRIPANLLFAVPDELHKLLETAKLVNSVEIVPVLRNKSYSANPEPTRVASTFLMKWIINKSDNVDDNKESTSSTIN